MGAPVGPRAPHLGPAPAPRPVGTRPWTTAGVAGGLALYALFAWLWLVQGEAVGAALLVGPLLVALTVPLLVRAARSEPGFDLAGLLLVGLLARLAFSYLRFENAVDGIEYHVEGVRLAEYYRVLDFGAEIVKDVPGTGAMHAISGGVHVLVLDDYFASFLVMAWLGFLGCWFLYRAFDLALPDGDRLRYAVLLMLWPSMFFWPASLGKDAWMLFTIGLASYGAARVYRRTNGGYLMLGAGLLAASFVRPHLALLALVAFVVALMVGRRHAVREAITPSFLAKIVGLVLVLVIGSVLVSRTQRILDLEDFSASSLQSAGQQVTEQTNVGNSTFSAPNPRSPAGFVEATVTVLFRPFPTEARGSEQLFTAIEGMLLAAITVASARRLAGIPRRLRDQPYVMYALAFVLLWILAFGVISNFGILARQRTQMLPFFFVLLSLAPVVVARRDPDARSAPRTPPALR